MLSSSSSSSSPNVFVCTKLVRSYRLKVLVLHTGRRRRERSAPFCDTGAESSEMGRPVRLAQEGRSCNQSCSWMCDSHSRDLRLSCRLDTLTYRDHREQKIRRHLFHFYVLVPNENQIKKLSRGPLCLSPFPSSFLPPPLSFLLPTACCGALKCKSDSADV